MSDLKQMIFIEFCRLFMDKIEHATPQTEYIRFTAPNGEFLLTVRWGAYSEVGEYTFNGETYFNPLECAIDVYEICFKEKSNV